MILFVIFFFLVPHSNLFITINPICLTVDYQTIIWLNAFYLNLTRNTMVCSNNDLSLSTGYCYDLGCFGEQILHLFREH